MTTEQAAAPATAQDGEGRARRHSLSQETLELCQVVAELLGALIDGALLHPGAEDQVRAQLRTLRSRACGIKEFLEDEAALEAAPTAAT